MAGIDSRKLIRWYDFTAPFYGAWRDDYDDPMLRHVRERLARGAPDLRVLDAGCGTGLYAVGLLRTGLALRIAAVDASAGMLRVARAKAAARGLAGACFGRADVTRLPFSNGAFDAVVAAGLVPNLEHPQRAFPELRRVLAPGGTLLVVEIDRESMSPGTRLFFRTMILGYRCVSALAPRFRFAEDWSLRRSTVALGELTGLLRRAGFQRIDVERRFGQLLLACPVPGRDVDTTAGTGGVDSPRPRHDT
jgi:ubiquinone/menaquinone biosynthesis C-methylase UbiE